MFNVCIAKLALVMNQYSLSLSLASVLSVCLLPVSIRRSMFKFSPLNKHTLLSVQHTLRVDLHAAFQHCPDGTEEILGKLDSMEEIAHRCVG